MVIALIALIAGLVVVNIESLLRGLGTPPLTEQLKRAVREARYQAVATKSTVELHHDAAAAALRIHSPEGEELARFATGYAPDAPDLEVQFYRLLAAQGLRAPLDRLEEEPVARVRFHADRSSTPFVVEITSPEGDSRHRYDPFSDVELQEEER